MTTAPVLYAEDDENDAFLMTRAFRQAEIINPLVVVSDGNAAIEYLSGKGDFRPEGLRLPRLVLLDLKMPGKSGLEVLEWIHNQPAFSTVPILMFTSSSQERDVRQAYQLGANGCVLKPSNANGMGLVVQAIKDFWLKQNLYIGPEGAGSGSK